MVFLSVMITTPVLNSRPKSNWQFSNYVWLVAQRQRGRVNSNVWVINSMKMLTPVDRGHDMEFFSMEGHEALMIGGCSIANFILCTQRL